MHSRKVFALPMVLASVAILIACIITNASGQATCPCSRDIGRVCNLIRPQNPEITDQCIVELETCDCFCDYSGENNNGLCPLDLVNGFETLENETLPSDPSELFGCHLGEVLMPRCPDHITVPTVSKSYDCSQDLTLYGRGYILCIVDPIECQPIISASLDYWQWSKYTANISFGEGVGFYNVYLEITNIAEYPKWFANGNNLPGVVIKRKGVIHGPAWKDEPSFTENKTFSSYGTKEFASELSANCKDKANKPTVFSITVDFQTANTGSDFNDQKPYGLQTITHVAVEVEVTDVQ
mmetsp:Transcript_4817/g.8863  ORF Transcript_4817/g.8863 Transcript_4817/m.8863 type:complete len:296 (+) Transcript_4817:180-1067(+)